MSNALDNINVRRMLLEAREVVTQAIQGYTGLVTDSNRVEECVTRLLAPIQDSRGIAEFSVKCDETPKEQATRIIKAKRRRYWAAYHAMKRLPSKSRRYRMWKRIADKNFNGFRANLTITPIQPVECMMLDFDLSRENPFTEEAP